MALTSAMPVERRLLRRNITYSVAKTEETNILHELGYWPRQNAFFDHIHKHRSLLTEVVAHHLGIHANMCQVADMSDWLHGSYNLCVPISVKNSSRVLVRFPLPYRVGDSFRPGNSDEKVRCEAGTYAWLQQKCPDVTTPRLYGFALSTGKVFTSLDYLPFYARILQHFRRWFSSLLRLPIPSRFVPHKCDTIKNIGPYLLLDVDSYVNGLLSYHDDRLEHQPNAVNGPGDCASQMTALAFMRTIRPHFFNPSLNHGPFVFSLTDLHTSNIFVDKDWNIKCVVDLEWAASLPLEFMRTPYWLSAQAIDRIDSEAYNMLREEFMSIFENEEEKRPAIYGLRRTDVMRTGWELGTFWYTFALDSPTGLHSLFYKRLQPLYSKTDGDDVNVFTIILQYWIRQPSAFIRTKLNDREIYDEKLRNEFHEPP
ncbi:hypothetical protein B7494_g2165 [Chlorociboria aeruginascens]|nr:hypothetical protein B7494_g2165 [Chlorociboria aeruginascens]